ncbi:MAG: hypothetical protein PHU85_08300 [Phycisphaerae bacterium]|nr:hypothetical protein [Phycisphaerae bacterium]
MMTTAKQNSVVSSLAVIVPLLALAACQQSEPGIHARAKDPGNDTAWPQIASSADARPIDKNGMLIRAYDARDLLHPLTEFRVRRPTSQPDGGGIFGADDTERQTQTDRFLGMIRATILPGSWAPTGQANILETDGLLVVRQTPEGHRHLTHLLRELGRNEGTQITVGFRTFCMPATKLRSLWRDQPGFLSDRQVEPLIADLQKTVPGSVASQMQITLLDGHQACILLQTMTDYVSATPARPGDPSQPNSASAEVRATASSNRQHVTLSVRFATARSCTTTKPELPGEESQTETAQEIGATTVVRNDHTAVWTWVQGERALLLLIRPHVITKEDWLSH